MMAVVLMLVAGGKWRAWGGLGQYTEAGWP